MPMPMRFDVVIISGGFSGLVAAYHAATAGERQQIGSKTQFDIANAKKRMHGWVNSLARTGR